MKWLLAVLVCLAMTRVVFAADMEAGKAKAVACAGCHGLNGISVSGDIPNLAGQKADYLKTQLKAFRDGKRKNDFMNVMAGQLQDADIDNLVAYFSNLPGATAEAKAQELPVINKTRLSFPANYATDYTLYTTINFPDRKEVRYYYANPVALAAARQGAPLPDGSVLFVEVFKAKLDPNKEPVKGDDGFFVKDQLAFFTAMEMQPGWGSEFPELIRNGDWNYAVFKADKSLRDGVNQAKCLVCHKPLVNESYLFTLQQLTEKARAMK
jgi:cytochrome c553